MMTGIMGRRSFFAALLSLAAALLASSAQAGRAVPDVSGLSGHRACHWRRLAG